MKSNFVADEHLRAHARLRTAKEARQLLEELWKVYQSLTPEEKLGVKTFMSDLLDSQRRFGITEPDKRH